MQDLLHSKALRIKLYFQKLEAYNWVNYVSRAFYEVYLPYKNSNINNLQ